MTSAPYIARLDHPSDASDWHESHSNVILLDPLEAARFEADNGGFFDVNFANDVHAGTSLPSQEFPDSEIPNSTWIPVPYEFQALNPRIIGYAEPTSNEQMIGLDVEHLIGSFSKCVVVMVTKPKSSLRSLNSTFVSTRDAVEESGVLDRAGLQKSGTYFHTGTHREHYAQRIAYLRQEGELENISINSDSQSTFWHLLDKIPDAKRAEIVLLDNGNLRTYWRNEIREYVGLELIKDESLRCLMHKRTRSGEFDTTVMRSITISDIVEAIDAFGMLPIFNS